MARALALLALLAAAACRPQAPPAAEPGAWAFVPVEGARCRDGSPTGIGLRAEADSRDLLLVLDGGGACFDAETCADTRARYGPDDFERQMERRGEAGLFSRRPENPVAGWTSVFVPYCTGDVHGGSRRDVEVEGVPGVQQFVGHENVERALAAVSARLGRRERVVVAGGSAGSYGALLSLPEVARRFPGAEVVLLADSGPVFYDDAVLSPALSAHFEALYGLSEAVPGAGLGAPDGFQSVYAHLAAAFPDAALGLVSYTDDPVIRRYFGAGQPDGAVSASAYAAGLRDLGARLPPPWRLVLLEGSDHVLLSRLRALDEAGVLAWLREALGE